LTKRTSQALFWISTGLAVAGLLLVVINAAMTLANRSAQTEVNQRQQFINQNPQVTRITEALVRALASAAVAQNDDALRDLLAQYGISVSATPSQAPVAPSQAPPTGQR
jgi:hypothetical protein